MAKGTIATLTIDLIGQSAKLRTELGKANKSTKSWAKKTREQVNAVSKTMATAAAAGAAAFTAMYVVAAKEADKLAKTSDKLGVLPEKLTALQHAGELTGVSVETTNMALQRMVRRVAEASEGTGEAVKALKELNINARELAQLSPDEQFKVIADAMGGVAGQGDKVRLAMKLFDSEGVALVNTLALGSSGLAEMEKEVDALGITLSRVELRKIENANDAFHRASLNSKAFGNVLAAEVAPIVEALSNEFVNSAKEAGGFSVVAKNGVESVAGAVGIASDAVHGLTVIWKGIKAAALSSIELQVSGIALIDRAVSEFLDALPGVSASANATLQAAAKDMEGAGAAARENFHKALMAPLPSEIVKEWIKGAQKTATEEAEKVTAETTTVTAGVVVETDSKDAAFLRLQETLLGEENAILQSHIKRHQMILENTTAGSDQQHELLLANQERTALAVYDHQAKLGSIEAAAAAERIRLSKKAGDLQLKHELGRLQDLTAGTAQSSKTMFKINKALTLASIAVSAPRAIAGAYAAGAEIGGPYLGAAYAAVAAIAQAAQLRAAKATEFSGGGTGTTPSLAGTTPVINDVPVPVVNENLPTSTTERTEPAQVINIFVDKVTGNDGEKIAEDLKDYISESDFVLIEPGSRNAQELIA